MFNPFSSFFSLLQKGSESVLGIDIGSSSVKLVELQKKSGRAVVKTYGEIALGPYAGLEIGRSTNLDASKLAEVLKDLLREAKASSRRCGIAIPLSASLVSIIELPAFSENQLNEVIPIEARKYIPVPISEVSLDWSVIPKEEVNSQFSQSTITEQTAQANQAKKIEVLIVAIHNEALTKYQQIVKEAGLDPSFFEIEIFSTLRGVIDPETAPVMVIDMGAGSTKVYIIERGVVRASHSINRGSQDITLALSRAANIPISEAEDLKRSMGIMVGKNGQSFSPVVNGTLSFIFSEANRTLLNFQQKYRKNVSKVIVSGGGANLKGFAESAASTLGVPVVLANPFAKTETPAFLENVLKVAGPEFSVAIGAGIRRLNELG